MFGYIQLYLLRYSADHTLVPRVVAARPTYRQAHDYTRSQFVFLVIGHRDDDTFENNRCNFVRM